MWKSSRIWTPTHAQPLIWTQVLSQTLPLAQIQTKTGTKAEIWPRLKLGLGNNQIRGRADSGQLQLYSTPSNVDTQKVDL